MFNVEESRRSIADPREAMVDALCKSTSSILSSGLTTVIGFAALCLLRFKIGPDLGLVLTKGVAISLISEIIFSENMYEAHIQVIQGKGFMPIEGSSKSAQTAVKTVKLLRGEQPIIRRYCAFMRVDNPTKHTQVFIETLKNQF